MPNQVYGAIANQLGFMQLSDNPPVSQVGWRFANALDAAQIYNANVGDFIIDGPNITTGGQYAIYMSKAFGNTPSQLFGQTVAPGKKVIIKGNWYSSFEVEFDDLVGTAENPIIVTNYFGQVKVGGYPIAGTNILGIAGGSHWHLTGKYDPVAKTGDPNYRGHDGGYAYSQGKYGFECTNNWKDYTSLHFAVGGNSTTAMANFFEVSYMEIRDGGGSGMNIKYDLPPLAKNFDMTFNIHDCYIHDIAEEGMYLGYNNSNQAHRLVNCKVHNNRIVRVGNEAIQGGNLAEGCDFYNNAIICCDTSWASHVFGLSQDRGIQFNSRNGEGKFRNNIVESVADYMIVMSNAPGTNGKPDNPVAGQDILIDNNYFHGSRNFGGYIFPNNDGITGYKIRNNWWLGFSFSYDKVYPGRTNQSTIFDIDNTAIPIILSGNYYQQGMVFVRQGATNPNVSLANNTAVSNIAEPTYVNSGFPPGFDYSQLVLWSATIGEAPGFPSAGTNKGQPNVFNQGNYCLYKSRIYRSKVNNNSGNEPQGISDSFWDLITFNAGQSELPPDDYRLVATDQFNYLGIGLEDNIPAISPNIIFNAPEIVFEFPPIEGFVPEIAMVAEEAGDNTTILRFGYNSSTLMNGSRIVAIGSSTLYGSGATSGFKLNEQLKAWVDANITNGEFLHMSLPGTYSDNFLPDADSLVSDWNRNVEAALSLSPDILIVSLPSNDPAFNTVEQYIDNLKAIDELAKARNTIAFFTTTQPRNEYDQTKQQALYDSAFAIRTAFGERAINVFSELAQEYTTLFPARTKPQYDSGDTIHVNNAGHTFIANKTIETLQAYFVDKYTKFELQSSDTINGVYTDIATDIAGTVTTYNVERTSAASVYYRIRGLKPTGTYTAYSVPVEVTQAIYSGDVIETIQLNLNTSATAGAVPQWNEFLPTGDIPNVGEALTNLVDTAGNITSVGVEITGGGFESSTNQGGAAGAFPLNVIRSYWFWGAGDSVANSRKAELTFSGLDDAYLYNFKFLFSRQAQSPLLRYSGAVIGNRRAAYRANDPVTASNNGTTADLLSVSPQSGEVVVKFKALATAGFGYLNAVIIEKCNNINSVIFEAPVIDFATDGFDVAASASVEGTVQLSFRGSTPSNLPDWNDINVVNGVEFGGLTTTTSQSTTISVIVNHIVPSVGDNGNSYVSNASFPLIISRNARYTAGQPYLTIKLKGLNPNKIYDVSILASRAANTTVVGFTINGTTYTQNVNNNLSPVTFAGVVPDSNREINITSTYVSGGLTGYTYLTALILGIKSPVAGPVVFEAPIANFIVGDISLPQAPGNVVFQAPIANFSVGVITIQSELSPATIRTVQYIPGAGNTNKQMWIFEPEGLPQRTEPAYLIISMTGSGQVTSGSTVAAVDDNYIPRMISLGDRPDPRFIICSPHCPGISTFGQMISDGTTSQMIPKWAYDYMLANYNINPRRVYVTGLSLGSAGTALFAQRYPDLVAAIIMAAGSQPAEWNSTTGYDDLTNIGIMSLHGTTDNVQGSANTPRLAQYINPLNPRHPVLMKMFFNVGHSGALWDDQVARRKSSSLSGNKASFDYDKFFAKFSTDLYETCVDHIAEAETTLDIEDYYNALRLVNKLGVSTEKTVLLNRLSSLLGTLTTGRRIFQIDLGDSANQSVAPVNNAISNANNQIVNNLLDITGANSTISFVVVNRLSNFTPQRVFSMRHDAEYRGFQKATNKDCFYVEPTISNGQVKFSNLNNAKRYDVYIYGCQDLGDTMNQNSVLRATIGATVISQYVLHNTTQRIQFTNVTPSSGEIAISLAAPNSGAYVGIQGLILIEHD